jgi:hypothetical protein
LKGLAEYAALQLGHRFPWKIDGLAANVLEADRYFHLSGRK